MKILRESFQDVELYLRSPDLLSLLVDEFGEELTDSEVSESVVEIIKSKFGEETPITTEMVVVCKVIDNDVDLLSTNHFVVNYNGYYYDYSAQEFSDSFDGLIGVDVLPVVQMIIHSDSQISNKLSTVRGYTMLGY